MLLLAIVVALRDRRVRAVGGPLGAGRGSDDGCGLILPALALAGFAVTALAAQRVADNRLDDAHWNLDDLLRVEIVSFPRVSSGNTTFDARVLTRPDLPVNIRVSWHQPPIPPAIGETWELALRLRPPRGFANPVYFDYERWLFLRGTGATAYVRDGPARRLPRAPPLTPTLRRALAERVVGELPGDAATAVLVALAVGSRHLLDGATRELFAATGTAHLMAISGLHIGLAAGLGWFAGRAAGALVHALFPRVSALGFATGVALATALGYGALAGFSVPTVRACTMLALTSLGWWFARPLDMPAIFALTAWGAVLARPLDSFTASFQMSFAVVAILLLLHARDQRRMTTRESGWWRFLRWQLLLSCLSIPLLAALFGRVSLLAPLANALAIPWFSFVVVPLLIFAVVTLAISAPLAGVALALAHRCTSLALAALDALGGLPFASIAVPAAGSVNRIAAVMALGVVLAPGRLRTRTLFLLAFAVIAWPRGHELVAHACFRLSLYDVGQGQAALIETSRHTLLYDTGPRFASGGSAAATVLVPALARAGIRHVDEVLVSHDDSDHSGGLEALQVSGVVGRVRFSGDPSGYPRNAVRCSAGQTWSWDGVEFAVLHPGRMSRGGNDASCVLRVSVGSRSALLTGDIERPAEQYLLADASDLRADLVTVPHHGSRTSSSHAFVRAVSPAHAWVSAGYRNRWGFPKPDIVARWESVGAQVSETGVEGMLSAEFCANGSLDVGEPYRSRSRRFWHAEANAGL